MNRIERWGKEGLLLLQRSDALLDELRGAKWIEKADQLNEHPPLWETGISELGFGSNLAGPDAAEFFRKILFPTTRILTPRQEHDMEHLRSHVRSGGDVFVTNNDRDFIRWGKQDHLSQLGIWVFIPAELAAFLADNYGWS